MEIPPEMGIDLTFENQSVQHDPKRSLLLPIKKIIPGQQSLEVDIIISAFVMQRGFGELFLKDCICPAFTNTTMAVGFAHSIGVAAAWDDS